MQPSDGDKSVRRRPPKHELARLTFRFRVARAGPLEIVVREVAPRCRLVWLFFMDAPAGHARVDLRSGPGGERLRAGRYVVAARRGAATLARTRIVVGDVPQKSSSCPPRPARRHERVAASQKLARNDGRPRRDSAVPPEPRRSGVLAAQKTRSVAARSAGEAALMIILAAATFLLALAALPRQLVPHTLAGAFIVRRRASVAAAGIAALAAFLVSYFLE